MSNRALLLTKPLGSYVFTTRSIPTPGPSQVVVENHAIALAPITTKLQSSPAFAEAMHYTTWPTVLGSELSGIIHSVGPDVTRFKPGDRVMGFSLPGSGDPDQGAFQNFTVVNAHLTSLIPDDMPFRQACILPASVGTAAGLLKDVGYDLKTIASGEKQKPGEAVLIWGGSGAVGSCAIQVAKAIGATVVTTASAQHLDYLRQLGADVALDRKDPSLAEKILSVTASLGVRVTSFIDANSSDLQTTVNIVSALGGGKLATVLPWEMTNAGRSPPANVQPFQSGVRHVASNPELGAKVMHDLTEKWLNDKALRATVIEVRPGGLDGIESGLRRLEQGLSGLKLVLDVQV